MSLILDGSAGVTYPNSSTQASSSVVLQVVQGTYATSVTNATTTLADTGVNATITPKFATSKILVLTTMNGVYNNGVNSIGVALAIVRNSTNINQYCAYTALTSAGGALIISAAGNYLDSPATTSATTYKVQYARAGSSGSATCQANGDISSITLLEIAA